MGGRGALAVAGRHMGDRSRPSVRSRGRAGAASPSVLVWLRDRDRVGRWRGRLGWAGLVGGLVGWLVALAGDWRLPGKKQRGAAALAVGGSAGRVTPRRDGPAPGRGPRAVA